MCGPVQRGTPQRRAALDVGRSADPSRRRTGPGRRRSSTAARAAASCCAARAARRSARPWSSAPVNRFASGAWARPVNGVEPSPRGRRARCRYRRCAGAPQRQQQDDEDEADPPCGVRVHRGHPPQRLPRQRRARCAGDPDRDRRRRAAAARRALAGQRRDQRRGAPDCRHGADRGALRRQLVESLLQFRPAAAAGTRTPGRSSSCGCASASAGRSASSTMRPERAVTSVVCARSASGRNERGQCDERGDRSGGARST